MTSTTKRMRPNGKGGTSNYWSSTTYMLLSKIFLIARILVRFDILLGVKLVLRRVKKVNDVSDANGTTEMCMRGIDVTVQL